MGKETPEQGKRRKPVPPERKAKGFFRAGEFAPAALKSAGAKRGFAELKLLTEWRAIAGDALAAISWPTKVTYGGRGGLGAALVLAVEGARAPEIEMQKARIIERVNAFYGYRAISRVLIDQSRAPLVNLPLAGEETGDDAPRRPAPAPVANVSDPDLALALARLGANVKQKAARNDASGQPKDNSRRSVE